MSGIAFSVARWVEGQMREGLFRDPAEVVAALLIGGSADVDGRWDYNKLDRLVERTHGVIKRSALKAAVKRLVARRVVRKLSSAEKRAFFAKEIETGAMVPGKLPDVRELLIPYSAYPPEAITEINRRRHLLGEDSLTPENRPDLVTVGFRPSWGSDSDCHGGRNPTTDCSPDDSSPDDHSCPSVGALVQTAPAREEAPDGQARIPIPDQPQNDEGASGAEDDKPLADARKLIDAVLGDLPHDAKPLANPEHDRNAMAAWVIHWRAKGWPLKRIRDALTPDLAEVRNAWAIHTRLVDLENWEQGRARANAVPPHPDTTPGRTGMCEAHPACDTRDNRGRCAECAQEEERERARAIENGEVVVTSFDNDRGDWVDQDGEAVDGDNADPDAPGLEPLPERSTPPVPEPEKPLEGAEGAADTGEAVDLWNGPHRPGVTAEEARKAVRARLEAARRSR